MTVVDEHYKVRPLAASPAARGSGGIGDQQLGYVDSVREEHRGAGPAFACHRRWRQLQRSARRHARRRSRSSAPRARTCGTSTATSTSTMPAGMGPMILGHNHPAVVAAVRHALEVGQLLRRTERSSKRSSPRRSSAPLPWIESIRIGLDRDRRWTCSPCASPGPPPVAQRVRALRRPLPRMARPAAHRRGGDPSRSAPCRSPPGQSGQSVAAADDVIICEWNDLAGGAGAGTERDRMRADGAGDVQHRPDRAGPGLPGGVRALCRRHGALLVIDEVITGFRLGLTGRPGLPRHPRRHLALRQGGGVRVSARRARDDRRTCCAPVGRGEVNHSGTYNAGVSRSPPAWRRCGSSSRPIRIPSWNSGPPRLVDELRVDRSATRVSPSTTSADSLFQFRFGAPDRCAPSPTSWSSPTKRC